MELALKVIYSKDTDMSQLPLNMLFEKTAAQVISNSSSEAPDLRLSYSAFWW